MRSAASPPIRRNQPPRIVQQRGSQRRRLGPSRRLDSRVKRANCVANTDPIARPGRPTQKTRRCGQQPCLRGMPLRAPPAPPPSAHRFAARHLDVPAPPLSHPQPLARPRKQVRQLLRREHQQRPRRRLRRFVQVVGRSVALPAAAPPGRNSPARTPPDASQHSAPPAPPAVPPPLPPGPAPASRRPPSALPAPAQPLQLQPVPQTAKSPRQSTNPTPSPQPHLPSILN